ALTIAADISDTEQAKSSVEQTVSVFGRLDVVVNNAGVMLLGPALEAPLEEWDRMIGINATALVHVTHAALPHLVDAAQTSPRGVSDLVNISSVAGRVARNGSNVYNLTKFGVGAFSESLRQELSPSHVRVSVIEPGAVDTELVDHVREGYRATVRQRLAEIERLQAADIADAIHYVVSRPRHVAINELLIRPTEQSS
ncbi:MAG: SDR family NAD(P)-dependent oxidoreductase, partial [Candidatus Dormibacteraeota bacterium]|nr:SDR family NAD(P)-dependent oxidoreductase [Candidatus Dormibacteraeota bacterium]